jgi:hypothetical protein
VITASGIRRHRRCAGASVLPRAETFNAWAAAGQDEHEELGDVRDLEHEFASLIPQGARSEVKLGYDVATGVGRVIGEGAGRDYGSPGPMEIVGSCDVLGVEDGDTVVIIDWKTGFADVAPARENEQLWFYALAACRALRLSKARILIVYTKTYRVDQHELDALDLADFATALERLVKDDARRRGAHQRGEPVDTREGDWCKHCPSKHACPSKNALLVQFGAGGLATVGDAMMTAERAAAAYRQVVLAEQLVKDARMRLDAYVTENGPIDLGEGRAFGRYARKGKESLDGNVAIAAIREVVGGEVAREFESVAIERKVSKASIERAAQQLVAVGASKTKNAVIKRIRELGGAKAGTEYPIGEYATDKHEAAPIDFPFDEVDAALKAVG